MEYYMTVEVVHMYQALGPGRGPKGGGDYDHFKLG